MASLSHNRLWRSGGPYLDYVPPGPGAREDRRNAELGGAVVKYHSRPSAQYRYEHYGLFVRA